MYIPEQFAEKDFEKITGLVKNNPFGMLISEHNGSPCIVHLPFLFEPNVGSHGKLVGHMAKDNPQWKSLIEDKSVVVVFNGAHGYISPTLYSTPGVPTWNYAVAHLHGKPTVIEDPAGIENILEKLTTCFESNLPNPWKFSFPVNKSKLLQMIVGFEINIQKIEGKFKLSQNKTPQERQNIINELSESSSSDDLELSKFMASYFG
ncbi:MAG: FMN-binding negative transcriptional regulator [Methylococcales bacterium]